MTRSFLLCVLILLFAGVAVGEEIIYEKRSLYRNINVTQDARMRCLKFAVREYLITRQSCMYLNDPDRLVFAYTQMLFAGLLVNSQPERILVIGLGGGSIPKVFQKLLPTARIDSVEIDPAVVDVAEKYFDFHETPNMRVFEQDGRVFVKRALRNNKKYDYIILDAFNGDYIPEHMMTREFLEECKGLLAPGGVLVANTFATSMLYKHESSTYAAVFDWFLNIQEYLGNRIILTAMTPLPDKKLLQDRALEYGRELDRFDINLRKYARRLDEPRKKDLGARILTDEYSPANLLNAPGFE